MLPKDIRTRSELSEWCVLDIRTRPELSEWCVLHGYRGSIAHGMYVPNSDPDSIDDKDTMAICIPPQDYYYGLSEFGSRGTKEIAQGEWDIVIYEVRKMLRMLSQANPNVLALLWLSEQYYIKTTDAGKLLLENRDMFSTKVAYKSFCGYANGQLHRMTHMAFEGYMGEKRKSLVKKHGYDTKNASHLIRLLRMGFEYLISGELQVERVSDAQELLEIKRGERTLEWVKAEAEKWFDRCHEAYLKSPLQVKVDRDKVNELCVEMVRLQHNRKD